MALLLCGHWDQDLALGHQERQRWLSALQAALPGETWVLGRPQSRAEAEGIEIAIVANPPPGALQGLPRLRLVQSLWAGVERLLQDETIPQEVPLARMVDPSMNEAMVQTALWAVLGLHRGFLDCQAQQSVAEWRVPLQKPAAQCQVLVMGLGELGGRVAQALAALGYAVRGWSRSPKLLQGVACLHGESGLNAALVQAEIVINLLPLTPQTRDFFDAGRLACMRSGASLVNLARGAHVDEHALLAALDRGHLNRAVLDVFRAEPLAADHPFWRHPRVTLLPHTAAQTDPVTAARVVAANVAACRQGRDILHRVFRDRAY